MYPKRAEGARLTLHLQEGSCRHEGCLQNKIPFWVGGFLSIINKRERMPFIHSFHKVPSSFLESIMQETQILSVCSQKQSPDLVLGFKAESHYILCLMSTSVQISKSVPTDIPNSKAFSSHFFTIPTHKVWKKHTLHVFVQFPPILGPCH